MHDPEKKVVFDTKKTRDSDERVLKLIEKRKLVIKSITLLKNEEIPEETEPSGWNHFLSEIADPKIYRKQLKGNKTGEFYIKTDFAEKSYRIKQIPDYDKKQYEYTTPTSVTLLPKHGKLKTFHDVTRSESSPPQLNVGMLFNLDECQIKSIHIYESDGRTGRYGQRYWHEPYLFDNQTDAQQVLDHMNTHEREMIDKTLKSRIFTTLTGLRQSTEEDRVYFYNEMLVGINKDSIEGLFARYIDTNTISPEEVTTLEKANLENYASKFFIIFQQALISEQLKTECPLFVFKEDGFHLYTRDQIIDDYNAITKDPKLMKQIVSLVLMTDADKLSDEDVNRFFKKISELYLTIPQTSVNAVAAAAVSVEPDVTTSSSSSQKTKPQQQSTLMSTYGIFTTKTENLLTNENSTDTPQNTNKQKKHG